MKLGTFTLLTPLGSGPDGTAYRARREDDGIAEVRVLDGARVDAERWKWLSRRLRTLAMVDHAGIRAVRELALAHEPPYVVLEAADDGEERRAVPLTLTDAIALTRDAAEALAAAHRLGLAHGALDAQALAGNGTRRALDLTHTKTGTGDWPETPDPAADVHALALMLCWLVTGKGNALSQTTRRSAAPAEEWNALGAETAAVLVEFLRAASDRDLSDRPSARSVAARLAGLLCPVDSAVDYRAVTSMLPATPEVMPELSAAPRSLHDLKQLGRYRLLEKLGQGGMGAVFRAQDLTDCSIVAIKVLRPDSPLGADAVRRFHKEARLLSEINNPFVTNLLEFNEDHGIHYLVLEFVGGRDLGQLLATRGKLDEATALTLIADVARGLVEAHERGIVHRDVKPDNILLCGAPSASGSVEETADDGSLRVAGFAYHGVKLSDFGLARHVEETASLNLTQAGAIVGTPLYMSPEQGKGHVVGPPADVYAMGATLFHMLVGRPPFLAPTPLALVAQHAQEPAPALGKLNPSVSDPTCRLVARTLSKLPEDRFAGAADFLAELERLRRGEPATIAAHPRLPTGASDTVLEYDFTWELEASPAQLWPYVSNTERLNRAIGLSAVEFEDKPADGRVLRTGQFRKTGMSVGWEEHPFEWIEGRRLGVLREFSHGPFQWLVSVVELTPRGNGGTTLTHRIRIEPRGLLGRTLAAIEVGVRTRRALARVYQRIDAFLTGKLGSRAGVDPFEEVTQLSREQHRRLEERVHRLVEHGIEPSAAERFGDFLAHAPDQEVARIRPLALARRLALDPMQVVAACLHGARDGLLALLWDLLCPVCRIPSEVKETLRQMREHGHCDACNLDFDLDFANSVEMIFRVHPEVRPSELRTYCIGGPAHSPHVAAQVRVAPGERFELNVALAEGAYRLRGPQLAFVLDFRVRPTATVRRWDLSLTRGPDPNMPRALKTGTQVLSLTNDHTQELVIRIERAAARDDALTAARAASMALFRELFPGEILAPGQLVSVATVTLLVTDLDGAGNLYEEMGDARAFALLHEQFRLLEDRIRAEGGALVKTRGEGVLAAFQEPVAAVRVGLDLPALLDGNPATRGLRIRAAVHRGSAMAATINDHLDYFGTTVNRAVALASWGKGGDLLLGAAAADDAQVLALLAQRGLRAEVVSEAAPNDPVYRLRAEAAAGNKS